MPAPTITCRSRSAPKNCWRVCGLCCGARVDSQTREAWVAGETVDLTAIEFDILDFLVRSAGRVVSRNELAAVLYQRESTPYERSLDVHISHLRRKLERGDRVQIRTVRGVGTFSRHPQRRRNERRGRMRTVFAKILLWSFGTLVLSLGAYLFISARLASRI